MRTVDLEAAIRDAAAAVHPAAQAYRVRIELALAGPVAIRADPDALATALRKTMLTAIRATPCGQVLVTASTLGTQLHIRVTDDGSGAEREWRETRAREVEASISPQGGSLAVETRSGLGATVTLRLPLPGNAGTEPAAPRQFPLFAGQAA